MWKRLRALLFVLTATVALSAGPPRPPSADAPPEPPARVTALPTPADAYALALSDARTLGPNARFVRYIFHPDNQLLAIKTTSLTVNHASRGQFIRRPVTIAGGLLVRIDLRWYTKTQGELAEYLGLWERFAFDPTFSRIITRNMLDFALEDAELAGNALAVRELQALKEAKVESIRLLAPHINSTVGVELQFLLGSQAPVVHGAYLQKRMLEQVQGKGPYTVIWGGMYYAFKGIKKAKDVLGADTKATDLDLYLESVGLGNIKAGLTADALFAKLRSDRRLAMTRSKVTGMPRDVDWFPVPGAQANINPVGFFTGDLFSVSIVVGQAAYANLEKPQRDGREGILPGLNKFPDFTLFNGAGGLVDEGPANNLVSDTTIPDPHPKRLQPARSCIICHGIFGDNGWRTLTNDVQAMLNPRLRLDVFDDRGGGRVRIVADVINRLAGRYQGRPDKPLRRNREDLAEAYLEACGRWPGGDGSQTDIVKLATLELQRQMDGYWYSLVDARQALREEGWDVPAERAVEVFNRLHAPDPRFARMGVVPENATVGMLKAGKGVSRAEWSLQFSAAMTRSLRSPYRAVLLQEATRKPR